MNCFKAALIAGLLLGPALPVWAEEAPPAVAAAPAPADPAPAAPAGAAPGEVDGALREALSRLPAAKGEQEAKEQAALAGFYAARSNAPLWLADGRWNAAAEAAMAEIARAGDWGLEAADFAVPGSTLPEGSAARATVELQLSEAVLLYARHARGGRIMDPAGQLSSNLNREPQLLEPREVMDAIAAAPDAAAYLRGLHPPQPQFERLRQKYLAVRGKDKALARRLLANMEEWRWMWTDMGDLYVLANIPEYMAHLVKDGREIHSERVAVGEIGKQTAVFTRTLKHVVLRPMWRVPESIKVRELLPSLRRGGGLMRQYGLRLETKDGRPLDYTTFDWATTDIRQYEVTQPPGPKSALGKVKFSFPSQHTIYMHDTPDKWMFSSAQRTLTHGCLRLRDPMRMAELILEADKGWDRSHIDQLSRSGPLDNHIPMSRKIPIHLTYFTVWIADDGSVRQYRDVYGHEKRILQALDGQWAAIDKGRDHLAPVVPVAEGGEKRKLARVKHKDAPFDFVGAFLGPP